MSEGPPLEASHFSRVRPVSARHSGVAGGMGNAMQEGDFMDHEGSEEGAHGGSDALHVPRPPPRSTPALRRLKIDPCLSTHL